MYLHNMLTSHKVKFFGIGHSEDVREGYHEAVYFLENHSVLLFLNSMYPSTGGIHTVGGSNCIVQ